MATSYYKDIYNLLCKKHPYNKIYLISDHHFEHMNIIDYERPEFSSVEEMNQHIIKTHNSVIDDEDIVIFLGDFSFKKGSIKGILEKMKGHKYLVLGNHDSKDLARNYGKCGFEGVFTNPVKIRDSYLSHYPLYDSEQDDINSILLQKEFSKSSGTNYHGHVHDREIGKKPYVNVCCEALDYKPMLIGYTVGVLNSNEDDLIINCKYFEDILTRLYKEKNIDPSLVIADYIYSMILELLTPYNNSFFAYGSFPLFKKYSYISNFSDLDIGILYDDSKSKKKNVAQLKMLSELIHQKIINIDNVNLQVEKRMSNICMLGFLYANKNGNVYHGCYDSNLINADIYRESDFVDLVGTSYIEKELIGVESDLLSKYKLPKFESKTLTINGDIANILLQLFFQKGFDDKKVLLIKKLNYIYRLYGNKDINNIIYLEDIMIRFFIRNVLFFYITGRSGEIDYFKYGYRDISNLISHLPSSLAKQINEILKNPKSKFNKVLKYIVSLQLKEIPTKSKELLKELKEYNI